MEIVIGKNGVVSTCDISIDTTITVLEGGKLINCLIRPSKEMSIRGDMAIHCEHEDVDVRGNVIVPEVK
jgi:hypothetical protein